MSKALSVASYFVAGFVLYMPTLVVCMPLLPPYSKLVAIWLAALLAAVLLWFGSVVSPTDNRQRDVGIVLVVTASVSVFILLSLYFMVNHSPPEIREMFSERMKAAFSDWPSGLAYLVVLSLIAGVVLFSSHAENEPRSEEGSGAVNAQ